MTDAQTTFGQTTALAKAIVAVLTAQNYVMEIAAGLRFERRTNLTDVPDMNSPAAVDVFPGVDMEERKGLSSGFVAKYGIHVIIQQQCGTAVETQFPILMQLRSQIIETIKGLAQPFCVNNAVHPFGGAAATHVASGPAGGYDMAELEQIPGLFYSDTIFTFIAAV